MSWDGKTYDKYRIAHADGTPLKGEKYFVLRLDSDDPVEAARVAAAMRAYKSEMRNCDVGTAEEQRVRFEAWCGKQPERYCKACAECQTQRYAINCFCKWAQMPHESEAK